LLNICGWTGANDFFLPLKETMTTWLELKVNRSRQDGLFSRIINHQNPKKIRYLQNLKFYLDPLRPLSGDYSGFTYHLGATAFHVSFDKLIDSTKFALNEVCIDYKGCVKNLIDESFKKSIIQVGLIFICIHEYVPHPTSFSFLPFREMVEKLFVFNLFGIGETYLKYKTATYFAHLLNQSESELPKCPSVFREEGPHFFFGGYYYRFFRSTMIHNQRYKWIPLGWSLLRLKNAMPSVTDAAVNDELKSTFDMLTKDQTESCQAPHDLEITGKWKKFFSNPGEMVPLYIETHYKGIPLEYSLSSLTRFIEYKVGKLFPKGWYKAGPFQIPSVSGHASSKRKHEGAFGNFLQRETNKLLKIETAIPDEGITCHQYDRLTRLPLSVKLQHNQRFYDLVDKITTNTRQDLLLPVELIDHIGSFLCLPPKLISAHKFMKEICRRIEESKNNDNDEVEELAYPAKLIGLKEPFKVRVISAGPEDSYYLARYRQKAVHSHLRSISQFRLIGERMDLDWMNKHFLPTPEQIQSSPEGLFVSGDYKAATNYLNPRLSEAVARVIARNANWSQFVTDDYLKCLTGHNIIHTDEEGEHVEPQRWGQLMGSPDSFPVLCLVNYCATLWSFVLYENHYRNELLNNILNQSKNFPEYCRIKNSQMFIQTVENTKRILKEKISFHQKQIFVNGDDIIFRTPDMVHYKYWENCTRVSGLIKSVGKNYVSPEYITINSRLYRLRLRPVTIMGFHIEDEYMWEEIRYINYGLILGSNGKQQIDSDDKKRMKNLLTASAADALRLPDLSTLSSDLIEGHPLEKKEELLSLFLKVWKDELIKLVPPGMSWFLPKHFGGLGIPLLDIHRVNSDGKPVISYLQRKLVQFLKHDWYHQSLLDSVQNIRCSDSSRLYKKALELLRESGEHLRECVSSDEIEEGDIMEDPHLAIALARSFLSLEPLGKEVSFENRYNLWYRNFQRVWNRSSKSTFPAYDLNRSTDWNKLVLRVITPYYTTPSTVDLQYICP
jgi:hypothetical protein